MTLPSVSSDLLIAAPSLSRVPADPAVLEFSEPARSTRLTCGVSGVGVGVGVKRLAPVIDVS